MSGESFGRMRDAKKPACAGFSLGGPSRARTDDLSDAIRTLSQLSYGPLEPGQCSPELVVTCPPNLQQLVVPRGSKSETYLAVCDEIVGRQQVTAFAVRAVEAEQIELARLVSAIHQTVAIPTSGVQA